MLRVAAPRVSRTKLCSIFKPGTKRDSYNCVGIASGDKAIVLLLIFSYLLWTGSSGGSAFDYNADDWGLAPHTGRSLLGPLSFDGYQSLTGDLTVADKGTSHPTPPCCWPGILGATTCLSATLNSHYATSVWLGNNQVLLIHRSALGFRCNLPLSSLVKNHLFFLR